MVVFLTDDQGWGDLSLHGNTNLETPNIDSLAKDGAQFERFYVCPVCSPTRAEFLTGRYHLRSGVYSTSAGGERLDVDETTIADVFRSAGYATGAFGKWHNGMQFPYHPNARGFDEFYGFCSGHWGDYFSPFLEHNNEIVDGEGFCVDDFTTKAIDFIDQSGEKPFFIYVPYNTPHSPMQVPDEYWDRIKDKELKMRNREPEKEQDLHLRCALAMCENIDWNVGRVLKKLEETGKADNTIVMYFCDNGPNGTRWNGDMKGRKGSTDEGGVRSPMLVRWPAKIKPGTVVKENSSVIDLLPTLAAAADIEAKTAKPIDGISLLPLLEGGKPKGEKRVLISYWKGKIGAKYGKFRMDMKGNLFNLEEDPGQRTNIADKMPKMVERLQKAMDDYKANVVTELPEEDPRPFVIGHPDSPNTQVPARDAIPHGAIKRSNKFPNDSYFLNWVNVEDTITWDVEVGQSGSYEVEMFYACANGSEGAELKLSAGKNELQFVVKEPNDVPERGGENDRSKRVESYTKDWKRVTVGEIKLDEGPQTMTLSALSKPGEEVMEFRLFVLKRK